VTVPAWLFDELAATAEDDDDLEARLAGWDALLVGAVEIPISNNRSRGPSTPQPDPDLEEGRRALAVDLAADVIACALTGAPHVVGRWWAAGPIRRGLVRVGLDDGDVVEAALARLGVEVRRFGAKGARWRLTPAPEGTPR
jgi:hypothetical protein